MKTFFSADYHLGHQNIISYANRPFKDVDHMNSEIIRRHNERVKKEDVLIHVGDFCFRNSPGGKKGEGQQSKARFYREQLNGDIIFIRGNHDNNNSLKTKIEKVIFKFANFDICANHWPDNADFRYPINFVGHVHTNWKFKRVRSGESFTDLVNVGCDVWNYYPQTFEEIIKAYHAWLKKGEFIA